MFDAKKLLDALVGGGAQQHAQQSSGGGGLGDLLGQLGGGGQGGAGGQSGGQSGPGSLSDILGQFTGAGQGGGQAPGAGNQSGGQGGTGGGLGDILGQLQKQLGGGQDASARNPNETQGGPDAGSRSGGHDSGMGGGLGDILAQLQKQTGVGGGGILDTLGKILGQAGAGVKEGAGRINDATGAGDALKNMTGGHSAEDLMNQLKDLIANNKTAAGAAAGGLGALVLGTRTGRGLAVDAAKLGGLVLIGGLAYKALQNYQQGKPLLDTAKTGTEAAPVGSGFETAAVTNESATLYLRAMIASAAADGRIDDKEQQKIFGSLKQAGMDHHAQAFLEQELRNPASIETLAATVKTPEEAMQVFTAARLAVDFDNEDEQSFLIGLANELRIDPELAQHIDAAARGTPAA